MMSTDKFVVKKWFLASLIVFVNPHSTWAQLDSSTLLSGESNLSGEAEASGRSVEGEFVERFSDATLYSRVKRKTKKSYNNNSQDLLLTELADAKVEILSPKKLSQPKSPAQQPKEKLRKITAVDSPKPIPVNQVSQTEDFKEREQSRWRRVEVEVASGMTQLSSESSFSYRALSASAPSLQLRLGVWTSPNWAVTGRYMSLFNADIEAQPYAAEILRVRNEQALLGVKYRQDPGENSASPVLEYGMLYREQSFRVPSNQSHRISIKRQGLTFTGSYRVLVERNFLLNIVGELSPMMVVEEQRTGLDLNSGTSYNAYHWGLELGGEIRLASGNEVLLGFQYQQDKTNYHGSANQADPQTGIVPTNVSVSESLTAFSVGYRWGK